MTEKRMAEVTLHFLGRKATRDAINDTVSISLDTIAVYPNGDTVYHSDFGKQVLTGEEFIDLMEKDDDE